MGKVTICHKQLSKVNKWNQEDIDNHTLELHKERSKHKWDLDLSI
jgi:hypothetical protein